MSNAEVLTPETGLVPANAEIVLLDRDRAEEFYDKIKAEVSGFVPDTSTAASRKEIARQAFRVTKAKTAIDNSRKGLTEEWRQKTKLVNEAGKEIVARLDALAAEVRRPLTEWEDAEKARAEQCEATIREIIDAGTVTLDDTAQSVRERGARIWSITLDADQFGDMIDRATQAKAHTVALLKTALARLTREEAERAELEKLRAEKEERDRIEAERVAEEEADRQRVEAEKQAEERRIAAEKADADRIARAKEEAAAEAVRAAEKAHAEALAAERRKADEAERSRAKQEAEIAAAEVARKAEEKRIADAKAAREADQAHRQKIKTAAKEAIMKCGASEDTAIMIVMAVIAGEIPAVRMEF